VIGLDRFRPEYRPPVAVPFASYHLMVGLGLTFIGLTLLATVLRWRGRLYRTRWLLWVFVFAVVGAVAANQLGWIAAEVGRQPWVVQPPVARGPDGAPLADADGFILYETATVSLPDGSRRETPAGLLTVDGVSEAVSSGQVLGSIVLSARSISCSWCCGSTCSTTRSRRGRGRSGRVPPGREGSSTPRGPCWAAAAR